MLVEEDAASNSSSQAAQYAKGRCQLYEPLGHLRVATYNLNKMIASLLAIRRKEEITGGSSQSMPSLLNEGLNGRLSRRNSHDVKDLEFMNTLQDTAK